MFNYDVDLIVNSNEPLVPTYTALTTTVDLYGMNYKKNEIKYIYKKAYTAPVKGGVQIPISAIKWDPNSTYQIRIEVVASDYYHDGSFAGREQGYGKPFIIEFTTPDDGVADYYADLLALIKAQFNTRTDIWTKDSGIVTGTDPDKLLHISFASEHFSIKVGSISKLNNDTLKWTELYKIVKSTDSSMIQVLGFGTYDFVLRNLRVPTYEALRFFAIYQDKRPIVGDQYTQYTIYTEGKRNAFGDQILGEDASFLTKHIYYVDTTKVSNFESVFNAGNANITITTV